MKSWGLKGKPRKIYILKNREITTRVKLYCNSSMEGNDEINT